MNYSSIKDNYSHGSVGDFLKEVITSGSDVAVVSAYFTIYAYQNLKTNLDLVKRLRFLYGEPTFIKSVDPEKANTLDFRIEENALVIPPEKQLTQKTTALECAKWIRDKVEIRSMVKPNFLHGKMYHVTQESGIEKAIAGSSNFTVNGLGLGGSKNIELNLIIDSDRERQELKGWFDSLWSDNTGLVEDVKGEVLKYLEQLYAENEPEFIYFKTLFHIFQDYLGEQRKGGLLNEKTGFYDSEIWNTLYDFQKDGVRGAINKILKHNGCIIADSVGLGKTYEALAVIKYFELLNARVLVICPKKLTANWTVYQASMGHVLNPFKKDRFNYTVLYHTDMGRESGQSGANGIDLSSFNWGAYDLVVIDESHNFRGNPMEKGKEDGSVRMNRAMWLMEKVIKEGSRTRVLMLSATPVNNTLRDLRNQIAFITEGKDDALLQTSKVRNISATLENAQRSFTDWAKKERESRNTKELLEKLDSAFFKILDELTIARSRKHIVTYYDITSMGTFPLREKPLSLYPEIDMGKRFPSYDRINKQILEYKLSIFNPSEYVRPGRQGKYEEMNGGRIFNFRQKDRENFLIGMMKVNFLKRLESSIESFEISLDRTIRKIEKLEDKINRFISSKATAEETSLDEFTPTEEELAESGDDADEWLVGKKLKFDLADLDLERWLRDLSNDKEALIDLLNNAQVVTPERDEKLDTLKRIIKEKVEKPFNGKNRKVLVFTAFADTAEYLYANLQGCLKKELKLHSALVCGNKTVTSFGKNDYDSILMNFSPLSKKRGELSNTERDGEIDILIATDCISEGQNLQDCDFLVNYDIHWNPVRIIQRFGRIDRLGSANGTIRMVNFWPTPNLDNYINLKERVEARMALVDVTATGEDNILNTEQLEELITDDLKYRNRQLKRLQNEVLDLEDMEETISLTDFTLDDFRIDLLNFIEKNKNRLEDSPMGLYAVVPAPDKGNAAEIVKPGVIYCLVQKNGAEGNAAVNPLNPCFLVYVREDGTVRYNYTHAKQILEIYRLLCQGKREPYEELCELFNEETGNGSRMDKYSGLLKKAADEIIRIFRKRENTGLTTNRGGVLIPDAQRIHDLNDFELVTWLIIK